MRALVIGRGSMGRRRIRDLTALGVEVDSWDITDRGSPPDAMDYQIVLVCTPPLTKNNYLQDFAEADVQHTIARYPSCTPLFTEWVDDVRLNWNTWPRAYTLHVGQHVDDWHPGADRSTYYAYRPETGPTREMIPFELIWLSKLFGRPVSAEGYIDPDVSHAIVLHEDGTRGHITIDALSRPPVRQFRLVGDGWQQAWDLTYDESVYYREMEALVAAVKGERTWPYSPEEEAANVKVLEWLGETGTRPTPGLR